MPKILPVFIPFMGCNGRCVYCNQHAISGLSSTTNIIASVQAQLARWRAMPTKWNEIAFYGGTFGNLPASLRRELYKLAAPLPIRYSTCPESITPELVAEMGAYSISTVELGVQSLSTRVLEMNGRYYSTEDVATAFSLIPTGVKKACQLMVGMYGESQADIVHTAAWLAALQPDYIRIYPTIILKNTQLESYYQQGQFMPLTAEEILLRAAWLYVHGETDSCRVIRIGLPPEADDSNMIAGGWWHPACGDMVRTLVIERWLDTLSQQTEIAFHPMLYGYKAALKERFAALNLRNAASEGIMKAITETLRKRYTSKEWFNQHNVRNIAIFRHSLDK